jgi:TP901 family phage tail tape measure protein
MATQEFGVRVVALGVAEFRRNIQASESDLRSFGKTIQEASGTSSTLGQTLTTLGNSITGLGRSLTIGLTVPLAALLAALVNAGIHFEDAFVGIGKTVEGVSVGFDEIAAAAKTQLGVTVTTMDEAKRAAQQMGMAFGDLTPAGEAIREQFRLLGQEIPLPLDELAKLGEEIGQLGVNKEQIVEVTRLMAEMGVATDLSATDAAFALIRLGNIMDGTALNVEDFTVRAGSAVVALGNASVSTEGEILNLAQRIAAAGDRANFSTPQLLAWATTLSDVGVRAELGGTAVSRALTEMTLAIQTGSENLADFATVSGKSTDEFAHDFQVDASQALLDFVSGLKKAFQEGTITKDMLEKMGLSGVRAVDVMGRLGNVTDLFSERLKTANDAWSQGIALQEEAEKRFVTIESKIQLAKNAFTDLGITIFDLVKDDLKNLIDSIIEGINWFKNLEPSVQMTILKVAAFAAALGPLLLILGTLISMLGVAVTVVTALISPVGLATVAIVAAGVALVTAFGPQLQDLMQKAQDAIQGFIDKIFSVPNTITLPSLSGDLSLGNLTASLNLPPDLKDNIDKIAKSLTDLVDTLSKFDFSSIVNTWDNLKSTFGLIGGTTIPIVTDAFNTLVGAIATASSMAQPLVQVFKEISQSQLKDSMKEINQALKDSKPVLDDFKKAWEELKPSLAVIIPAALALLAIMITLVLLGFVNLIRALASMASPLTIVADGIAHLIMGMAEIVNGLLIFATGLQMVGKAVADFFVGLFSGVPIADLMQPLITGIALGLQTILAGLILWGDGIVNNFLGLFQVIFGIFMTALTFLLVLIGGWIQTVIQFFTDLYTVLVGASIIPDLVLAIINWFLTLVGSVVSIITQWVSDVIGIINNLAAQFIAAIQKMVVEIQKKIQGMVSQVKSDLESIKMAVDHVINAFQTFLNWLNANVARIISLIGQVADAIAGLNAIALGSPELKIHHGFEDFDMLLQQKTTGMVGNISELTSAIAAMNGIIMPSNTDNSSSTQNSLNIGQVVGSPGSNESQLADTIVERWQVATGGAF